MQKGYQPENLGIRGHLESTIPMDVCYTRTDEKPVFSICSGTPIKSGGGKPEAMEGLLGPALSGFPLAENREICLDQGEFCPDFL